MDTRSLLFLRLSIADFLPDSWRLNSCGIKGKCASCELALCFPDAVPVEDAGAGASEADAAEAETDAAEADSSNADRTEEAEADYALAAASDVVGPA